MSAKRRRFEEWEVTEGRKRDNILSAIELRYLRRGFVRLSISNIACCPSPLCHIEDSEAVDEGIRSGIVCCSGIKAADS